MCLSVSMCNIVVLLLIVFGEFGGVFVCVVYSFSFFLVILSLFLLLLLKTFLRLCVLLVRCLL